MKIAALSTCLIAFMTYLEAATVTLRADVWCPYNCDPRSSSPGFMVEVADAAFKMKGDAVEYLLMDWTRAVADVESGKYDGLIATTTAITPDFIFPKQELALATQYFWTKKASSWVFTDISSLENMQLVIMDSYSYGPPLDDYIAKHKKDSKKIKIMSGNDGRAEAANYVLSADNAVFIEEAYVMKDFLVRSRLLEYFNQVESKIPPTKMYIAFTSKIPQAQAYADILDAGITTLKQNGQWERLLDKYGIKQWPINHGGLAP